MSVPTGICVDALLSVGFQPDVGIMPPCPLQPLVDLLTLMLRKAHRFVPFTPGAELIGNPAQGGMAMEGLDLDAYRRLMNGSPAKRLPPALLDAENFLQHCWAHRTVPASMDVAWYTVHQPSANDPRFADTLMFVRQVKHFFANMMDHGREAAIYSLGLIAFNDTPMAAAFGSVMLCRAIPPCSPWHDWYPTEDPFETDEESTDFGSPQLEPHSGTQAAPSSDMEGLPDSTSPADATASDDGQVSRCCRCHCIR
jgi:hypothetical protein